MKPPLRLIYIAGRFRAKTPWDVEQNIRRAEEFGLAVARAGAFPVIPHTMTRFFDGAAPDEIWLEGDKLLLDKCDAIALVPGNWQGSSGTHGEIERAIANRQRLFVPKAETPEFVHKYLNQLSVGHRVVYPALSQLEEIGEFARGER